MASCHVRLTSLRSVKVSNQLRQLRQAARSLSEDASKTLVYAFVSCCLDYCNSQNSVFSVEPVAVGSERRRLSGFWYWTFRHITPLLRQLYIGYRYASASTLSFRRSFIGRCRAFHNRSDRTSQ